MDDLIPAMAIVLGVIFSCSLIYFSYLMLNDENKDKGYLVFPYPISKAKLLELKEKLQQQSKTNKVVFMTIDNREGK